MHSLCYVLFRYAGQRGVLDVKGPGGFLNPFHEGWVKGTDNPLSSPDCPLQSPDF